LGASVASLFLSVCSLCDRDGNQQEKITLDIDGMVCCRVLLYVLLGGKTQTRQWEEKEH